MSRNPGTSVPGLIPVYRAVWIRPNRLPVAWASRAISADHSGATALVPPTTCELPPDMIRYPVTGSALPATSGTPRPPLAEDAEAPPALAGTPALACQLGRENWSETPPPPAPSFEAVSFHTTSELTTPVAGSASNLVPPHPSAWGLDAGKSQCTWPSLTASPLPLSPAATHTVIPRAAASAIAESIACRPWSVQESSDSPQLIEIAIGVGLADVAAAIASTKPWSPLFGAKYTTCAAPGAAAPMTWMSSATSTSAPFGSEPGALAAPSTPTAVIEGTAMPSPPK